MADNELKTKFVVEGDESAKKKLLAGISEIEERQKKLAIAVAKGSVEYEKGTKKLDEYAKKKSQLAKVGQSIDSQFTKEAKALGLLGGEAEKAALSFGELADKRKQAINDGGAGFAGDTAGAVGGARGAVDALSGGNSGALGKGLEGVEAIADLGEFLPLLAGQMKTVFDTAKSGSGILGGVATALTPALGGTAAAFTAVLLPVAALAAAVIPLVIGFQMAQKQSEQYVAALQREADVRQSVRDASRDAAATAADGTQALVDARQAVFEELAARSQDFAAENAVLLQQNQTIRDAGWGELPRGTRAARDEQQKLVEEMGQDITILTSQLAEYDAQLVGVSQEEINRALNVENLTIIQQELDATEQQRIQTTDQLAAAQSRVSQLDEQRASLIENRAQQETFAAQNAALENKFANEDQAAQNRELYDELGQIADDGKAKLLAIETDLANLRVEQAQAISDIEAKGSQKVAKLNSDYFAKQIKATQDFARQTERIESDNAKARRRLLEDITEQLNDAESNNDVLAFLSAQRDGAKALRDQAEDADEAEKRRVEDFALAQEEAALAQQERLVETIAQIAEEKAQVIASYAEKQAALLASKEAEKQAIAAASAAAMARYTETEEREQQAADRQAEREALREEQQDTLFQQQLADIETKKQKELAAVAAIGSAIDVLAQKAAALRAQSQQISTQSAVQAAQQNSSSSSSPFSFSTANYGSSQPTAFARGGIIDKPTIALMGEKGKEMVIPFKNSPGLPAALDKHGIGRGGNNINITAPVNVTVGDIASASMVRAAVQEGVEAVLYDAIAPLLENALSGKSAA